MKFVDQIRVHAKAGDGGDGCCSFRREKFVPKGGPDGGNGGKGGDIILHATTDTGSLVDLFYQPLRKAKNGGRGQGSDRTGKNATNEIIRVPVGTLVYSIEPPASPESFEMEEAEEPPRGSHKNRRIDPRQMVPIHDLAADGDEVVLCKGGDGGRGNASFKSSTNRAPRRFTPGYPGEEGWFLLELQSIAFAGLVGYPNAGKSTLLNAISAARPKVAPYPFTTLHPHIGIVQTGEYETVSVADIPGVIEGAHADKGLGHDFLRHILRCRLLLFVVDTPGSEGRHPVADLESLRKELALFDPLLAAKPWCVVANKMDLPGAAENLTALRQRFPDRTILPVSAAHNEGIPELCKALAEFHSQYGDTPENPIS